MTDYEDEVRHELTRWARSCRSKRGLERAQGGDGCARGVPVTRKAVEANNGSRYGIALRLPCDGCADPLFRCPWYEAKGVDQARQEMTDLRAAGARTLKRLAGMIEAEAGKSR